MPSIHAEKLQQQRPAGIGPALKHWRRLRGVSQLDLALEARVSARHVSFLESGRSRPSREMVLILARALRLPLRERNDLLDAAGFARIFSESALGEAPLALARQAIELLLSHQEPYPAVVLDRRWNVREINAGARRLFTWLRDGAALDAEVNLVRSIFDPRALRRHLANWSEVAASIVQRIRSEAVAGVVDPETEALLGEISRRTDLPADWLQSLDSASGAPILPVTFVKDGARLAFFSAVTTIGTPRDITLQELRIEHFFPVDETTKRVFAELPRVD
jgi:transcriptional regulator with XRE-family HTH domain